MHTKVWRVADAINELKFKFVPNIIYHGHAGHRWWAEYDGEDGRNYTEAGYSDTV